MERSTVIAFSSEGDDEQDAFPKKFPARFGFGVPLVWDDTQTWNDSATWEDYQ